MKLLPLLLLLLALAAPAQAQPARTAWALAQGLRPGRLISVQTIHGRTECAFFQADFDSLHCSEPTPTGLFSSPVKVDRLFLRAEILSIRPRPRRLTRAFVLIGASVGFITAVATADLILGAPLMIAFGAAGFVVGELVDIVRDLAPRAPLYIQPIP